ncbi:GNAT family N-acetyltransferase [Oceanobacillus alkalisoli]|uniref:GNAT family N-acetyltransferase n=1 Tax=Oceanobacillus alkalisoli TaxID=2925113 RepID=UPI001EF13CF1|nr:GNAT family N-acetyltransferase [Oceanobacillus alkalisoli]MCF3944726.1 GNAT family N-acetyltransferase [Oceanobacillus alkalisoli]MCG5104330.1 GNAT family N-acetyltransferase [Oceanobacillus alkalisoli]
MLQFVNIDLDSEKHREIVTKFRRDSFEVSFGDGFDFDEEDYLHWLKEKIADYPKGFVLVKKNNNYVGQLELSVRQYEGKDIGYVHLYYLTSVERGKSIGQELHDYARQFFKANNIKEFHLRVSPTNIFAIKFYRKIGMNEIGPEVNGKVIRMKGSV